jgi:hypothetical protein
VSADPTQDEANQLWGVPVLVTTQCQPADGLLIDTTKFGRAIVREPLSMRIGWSNDDFVRNVLRTVCEERLNLAVERPTSILHLTNLPLTALTGPPSRPSPAGELRSRSGEAGPGEPGRRRAH